MKAFPKKYKPQDLRNRANNYRKITDNQKDSQTNIYSLSILPTSTKISYLDFFLLYIKDFINCKLNINNKKNLNFQHLITPSNDEIVNISSCYNFFSKK